MPVRCQLCLSNRTKWPRDNQKKPGSDIKNSSPHHEVGNRGLGPQFSEQGFDVVWDGNDIVLFYRLNQLVDVVDEFLSWFQPAGDIFGFEANEIGVVTFLAAIEQVVKAIAQFL